MKDKSCEVVKHESSFFENRSGHGCLYVVVVNSDADGSARRTFVLTDVRAPVLCLTCEHGGREVPSAFAPLFAGQQTVLDSHRGWDPGALTLGVQMAQALGVPLFAATTTRLLVELNRSLGHPQLLSEFTRHLSAPQRMQIIDEYYRPHRDEVEGHVARLIASGHRVVHVASHSFTPELDGQTRRADVAWLYDPRRPAEKTFAAAWLKSFAIEAPALKLRRNYPYQGRDDGLMSLLRKRFPDDAYLGVELEVNQRFVSAGGAPWDTVRRQLTQSLATTFEAALAPTLVQSA
jgi:predicted N-formylglutamate amidohydrolase